MQPAPALIRSIGPFQLTLYGLGSMLGSGIYGLVGQAAGQVGNLVWASFLVAMAAALLTALSYASLGSRHPRAGGAAFVTQKAYGRPLLSFVVGLAVVCSGLASVATQSQVFAGNLVALLPGASMPPRAAAAGFLLVVASLVLRGIRESMWVNVVFTLVEAGGLLLVIAVGLRYWGSVDLLEMPASAGGEPAVLLVMQGAVLTFFAYIGFEDTLNVAEECRDPQRTVPIALVTAMLVGATIYVAVAITAVSVVPWQDLSQAPGPLTEVMARAAPAIPPLVFTAITLFAVANTALVNYITSSRLVYGMAQQGLLPRRLGSVHHGFRTPHLATIALLAILLPLGLLGSVANLASAAVLLLLGVFAVVNGALFVLQRRVDDPPGRFEVPRWVPAAGMVLCVALIGFRMSSSDWHAPALAGGLLLGILALYALVRPSAVG
ncbi:amino acid permease [Ramlibacter algicola]|uniref:Amino acid permease n=1 Tax=Ramlibacter algicola TaxID=2795217 RepID=A0A934Q1J8_9BURK|nr:amino acid permease [Ramlibacter algicola]